MNSSFGEQIGFRQPPKFFGTRSDDNPTLLNRPFKPNMVTVCLWPAITRPKFNLYPERSISSFQLDPARFGTLFQPRKLCKERYFKK